jgi:predicted transcriptional regulator
MPIEYLEILKTIDKFPEKAYTTAIAKERKVTEGTVTEQIAFLRLSGLIKRGKRDKIQYYEITSKGKNFLEKHAPLIDKFKELERDWLRIKEGVRKKLEEIL